MALERILPEPPSLGKMAEAAPIALFLDFDGTLVDIAPTPDSIHVPSQLGAFLAGLSEALGGRVALVSGRSLADLARHLGEIPVARAGSHGAEKIAADGRQVGAPAQSIADGVRDAMSAFAMGHEGVEIERKTHGCALHYRASPALGPEVTAFAEKLAADAGLATKRGNCVIEVLCADASKSAAVAAFMATPPFAGAIPVFVGDDITDEDGFRAAGEYGGFGILVGNREPTIARYSLRSPDDVHTWLETKI